MVTSPEPLDGREFGAGHRSTCGVREVSQSAPSMRVWSIHLSLLLYANASASSVLESLAAAWPDTSTTHQPYAFIQVTVAMTQQVMARRSPNNTIVLKV